MGQRRARELSDDQGGGLQDDISTDIRIHTPTDGPDLGGPLVAACLSNRRPRIAFCDQHLRDIDEMRIEVGRREQVDPLVMVECINPKLSHPEYSGHVLAVLLSHPYGERGIRVVDVHSKQEMVVIFSPKSFSFDVVTMTSFPSADISSHPVVVYGSDSSYRDNHAPLLASSCFTGEMIFKLSDSPVLNLLSVPDYKRNWYFALARNPLSETRLHDITRPRKPIARFGRSVAYLGRDLRDPVLSACTSHGLLLTGTVRRSLRVFSIDDHSELAAIKTRHLVSACLPIEDRNLLLLGLRNQQYSPACVQSRDLRRLDTPLEEMELERNAVSCIRRLSNERVVVSAGEHLTILDLGSSLYRARRAIPDWDPRYPTFIKSFCVLSASDAIGKIEKEDLMDRISFLVEYVAAACIIRIQGNGFVIRLPGLLLNLK